MGVISIPVKCVGWRMMTLIVEWPTVLHGCFYHDSFSAFFLVNTASSAWYQFYLKSTAPFHDSSDWMSGNSCSSWMLLHSWVSVHWDKCINNSSNEKCSPAITNIVLLGVTTVMHCRQIGQIALAWAVRAKSAHWILPVDTDWQKTVPKKQEWEHIGFVSWDKQSPI